MIGDKIGCISDNGTKLSDGQIAEVATAVPPVAYQCQNVNNTYVWRLLNSKSDFSRKPIH